MPLSEPPLPEPTSPVTLVIGWGVYILLVLVGFSFGAWAGNQKPTAETAQASPPSPSTAPSPAPSAAPKPPAPTPAAAPAPVPKKDTSTPAAKKPTETKSPDTTPAPEPKKAPAPEPKTTPSPEPKAPAVVQVSFMKDVMPVFRTKCLNCHGGVGNKPKGGLDLRTIASTLKGGDNGAGVKPGDLKGGTIWTSIEDSQMPPADKDQLTDAEKMIIRNWILSGAK